MNRHLLTIDGRDDKVKAVIRSSHASEFAIVEEGLECIARAFLAWETQQDRLPSRLDTVRVSLAIRSFNSIRIALTALISGYYQQAWTLVRSVMEDQLVAQDAEIHTPTLEALLTRKSKLGRGDLSLNKMAERISPQAKDKWDRDYGRLSTFAAHPRYESVLGILAMDPEGQYTLQLGGHYDEREAEFFLLFLIHDTLGQLKNIMKTIVQASPSVDYELALSCLSFLKKIEGFYDQINQMAEQENYKPEIPDLSPS